MYVSLAYNEFTTKNVYKEYWSFAILSNGGNIHPDVNKAALKKILSHVAA